MEYRFSDRVLKSKKSFIREILKAIDKPGMISFAGGLPNPISFPIEEIKLATQKVLETDGANALQYSTTEGYLPLRKLIAERYNKRFGITIDPANILITNGSQQALDLAGKVFLNKGDKIAIERPGYLGAIQALSFFEPQFCDIALNDDGINLDELGSVLKSESPKLFYSVPNFQNPTGISYTEDIRIKAADIIKNSNTVLIEDDPYGELRFMGEQASTFKALAPDNVIALGSFSKIVSPGMRLGWMVACDEIIDKAITAKQGLDLHTNYFAQRVVCQYLEDNDLDAHIEKIKELYKYQRNLMVDSIEKYFPEEVTATKPQGGMFLWAYLPENISATDVFEKAYANNVAFVPGEPFYANNAQNNTLRLNYSNSDGNTIEKGIKTLGGILKEMI